MPWNRLVAYYLISSLLIFSASFIFISGTFTLGMTILFKLVGVV